MSTYQRTTNRQRKQVVTLRRILHLRKAPKVEIADPAPLIPGRKCSKWAGSK